MHVYTICMKFIAKENIQMYFLLGKVIMIYNKIIWN
jgi:hypothetical protein